jgi:hypothetical protein
VLENGGFDQVQRPEPVGPVNLLKTVTLEELSLNSAYLTAQKIANRNKFIGNAAKSVGLGGLGYEAVKAAHQLVGSN